MRDVHRFEVTITLRNARNPDASVTRSHFAEQAAPVEAAWAVLGWWSPIAQRDMREAESGSDLFGPFWRFSARYGDTDAQLCVRRHASMANHADRPTVETPAPQGGAQRALL